ncbi:MAG: tetratricopeptide repeat protein, partial [Caldilineaceae bacterium]|nr:tetratricopeptide repeat protein [Caldilineaceae bacterium]
MAHAVESKTKSNPANALRDALTQAERQLVQLNGDNAEEYLVRLDQIEQMFDQLDGGDLDLRPERVRWQSLIARLSSQPGPLASAAAKAGGLPKLRAKHPPAESFWWHVDAEVARRRLNTARRLVISLVMLVVVFGGGYWLLNTLFPPNPDAVRMLGVNSDIDPLLMTGQWEDALAIIKDAQADLPNEAELYLWEVVITTQLGRADQADQALARARELLPDRTPELWVQLGNFYLQIGDVANATAAGAEASALAP